MAGTRSPKSDDTTRGLGRRDFLKRTSLVPLAAMAGIEIRPSHAHATGRPTYSRLSSEEQVACGLIGFGEWGRELASTLARIPNARIAAISDNFPLMLQRAQRSVSGATLHDDYRRILDDPEIRAVFVATPTHLHKDVVLAALGAGKNVYCEAPLAHTIEDARAIALAARGAGRQIFQAGLPYRSNPQHREVFQFIRSGALGRSTFARAQWNRKQSWRRASATPARERELNWRLDHTISTGLPGEIGIHQLDTAGWILQRQPRAQTPTRPVIH
jgi:predicted dehydrogenase